MNKSIRSTKDISLSEIMINKCILEIEKKTNFGESKSWTNRDFENLSLLIEKETKVNVSVSTLKRIWKGEYDSIPQKATLNALANFIGFENWLSYTSQNTANKITGASKKRITNAVLFSIFAVILILYTIFFIQKSNSTINESNDIVVMGNDHHTVITRYNDSVTILGDPMTKSKIIKGQIGWNGMLSINNSDIFLTEPNFWTDNKLSISTYLNSLNISNTNNFRLKYYNICESHDIAIQNFILKSTLEQDDIYQFNDSILIFEIYTNKNLLSLHLNTKKCNIAIIINDSTLIDETATKEFECDLNDAYFELSAFNNKLKLSINSKMLFEYEDFKLTGHIISYAFIFDTPVTIKNPSLQSNHIDG